MHGGGYIFDSYAASPERIIYRVPRDHVCNVSPHHGLRFSMSLTGAELIQDCTIELTIGRRYGLLGMNGSGKSNFLKCLAAREVR